jgi:aerotaxis receptor
VMLPVTGNVNDGMRDDEWICSKTDTEGVITYANDVFCRVSGYSADELVGQPHNIVRHPDMPCIAFAWCWDTLQQDREWKGVVKNRCKNGDTYWVDVTMTPQRDENGTVVGYYAVRRKVSPEKITEMEALYRQLAEAEGSVEQRAQLSRREIFEMYKQSPLYALAHPEAAGAEEA